MRHSGTRAEQQRADGCGRDVYDTTLVRCGDRISVAVDRAPFQIDEGDTVHSSNQLARSGRWRPGDTSHISVRSPEVPV